jgi:hypothetical protein
VQNHRTQDARASVSALLVCDDDDTLIRLRDYLTQSGVQVRATRQLGDVCRSPGAAVILLPDDFDAGEVTACLSRLLSGKTSPFLIVITAMTRLFEPLAEAFGNPQELVIMPKPVWGWTILDLLRSRGRE